MGRGTGKSDATTSEVRTTSSRKATTAIGENLYWGQARWQWHPPALTAQYSSAAAVYTGPAEGNGNTRKKLYVKIYAEYQIKQTV
jgi:hypothetical protein